MDVIVCHNPKCGTSRNVLGLICNARIEPHVIEYVKTPPTRQLISQLAARTGQPIGALLRDKETIFASLGLDKPDVSDEELLDAIEKHPVLLNRPVVVSPKGVKLCRPSELVLDLLPAQQGEFFKEDGERVVDEKGRHVASA